jgi:radical SAM superfamily enzyme YgiQ (UPF0313 family)
MEDLPVPAARRATRLLLINPRLPESFWSFRWWVNELYRKRAVNPPLGLATLAALTPSHWEITIVDENVESIPLRPEADLVGVCGMGVQHERQKELLAHYRGLGYPVVAGGSYASLCPEKLADLADTVVAGEAEYIWKLFCADWERGAPERLYRESGIVRLEDSPVPRFDLLHLDRYATASLQFSRGCPYLCEFCDIIVMFGRKPRHKALAQVGAELDALHALGVGSAFFVDDNLIGNRAVARELLIYIAQWQREHGYPFQLGTEVSINLAEHDELLELLRDAGFSWVFIGIESPDPQTLKDARKPQNTRGNLIESVRRFYAHGVDVLAGFIVGFDNDTVDTFDRQYDFIVESGIQVAMVGLLTALPRTPLYERLAKEGRLRELDRHDNTKPATNVMPLRMSYEELVHGYEDLYRRLTSDRAIASRVRSKMRFMVAPLVKSDYAPDVIRRTMSSLALRILAGGPSRVWHFLSSMPWRKPGLIFSAAVDWIAGLSMQDYYDRHFDHQTMRAGEERRLRGLFARLQGQASRSWDEVRVALTFDVARMPDVSVLLRGGSCRDFLRDSGRDLEALMRRTGASLTIRIESLLDQERAGFEALLQRLSRHGDRIFIEIAARSRDLVSVDSSVFRLRLFPKAPTVA